MPNIKAHRWAYGAAAIIFLLVGGTNGWMVVSDGFTTFRIIAAIAFAVGGLLLLMGFSRLIRPRPLGARVLEI